MCGIINAKICSHFINQFPLGRIKWQRKYWVSLGHLAISCLFVMEPLLNCLAVVLSILTTSKYWQKHYSIITLFTLVSLFGLTLLHFLKCQIPSAKGFVSQMRHQVSRSVSFRSGTFFSLSLPIPIMSCFLFNFNVSRLLLPFVTEFCLFPIKIDTHLNSYYFTFFRGRTRHVDENFDLDLTYITDRIIGW